MNFFNHLLHHHNRYHGRNVGMLVPSGDVGTLADTIAAASPTVKIAGAAAIGAAAGHFAGKHTLIGALLGAAGGYYYAQKSGTTTSA